MTRARVGKNQASSAPAKRASGAATMTLTLPSCRLKRAVKSCPPSGTGVLARASAKPARQRSSVSSVSATGSEIEKRALPGMQMTSHTCQSMVAAASKRSPAKSAGTDTGSGRITSWP